MRLHRFYVGEIKDKAGPLELDKNFWVHDKNLISQWLNVLRYRVDDQLVLFNDQTERIYKITKIEAPHSINLELITEQKRILPKKHVYLMWGILKKDKNDFVLQKATELGVRNFVPLITSRSQKKDINIERAKKIIKEASEQCGRSDIPEIREPITLHEALNEYTEFPLFVCQKTDIYQDKLQNIDKFGLLIGPEGGWSDAEIMQFKTHKLKTINIADFTLRAETAAIIAVAKLLQ